jgi:hypothetical protein
MRASTTSGKTKPNSKLKQKLAFDAKLFSIRLAWPEELWSIEGQRRSTLKVIPPRV